MQFPNHWAQNNPRWVDMPFKLFNQLTNYHYINKSIEYWKHTQKILINALDSVVDINQTNETLYSEYFRSIFMLF